MVGNIELNSPATSGGDSPSWKEYTDFVMQNTDANNAWSASQAASQNAFQERMNSIAMLFNQNEAQKNRDWQELLSNTAHQREIADLQAAGLNPVLSASGGNGAPVGSGATASGVTSSGAKGETDTSANQAIASMFSALTSAKAQRENAQLSAKTQLESARLSAEANMYAASLSAAIAREQMEHDTYIHQNYPNSEIGGLAALLHTVFGEDGSTTNSSNASGLPKLSTNFWEKAENTKIYQDYADKIRKGDKVKESANTWYEKTHPAYAFGKWIRENVLGI